MSDVCDADRYNVGDCECAAFVSNDDVRKEKAIKLWNGARQVVDKPPLTLEAATKAYTTLIGDFYSSYHGALAPQSYKTWTNKSFAFYRIWNAAGNHIIGNMRNHLCGNKHMAKEHGGLEEYVDRFNDCLLSLYFLNMFMVSACFSLIRCLVACHLPAS